MSAAIPELAGPGARGAITVAHGQRIVVKGDAGHAPLRFPLPGRGSQGVLSVDAPGGFDRDTRLALETSAGELGIALESAGPAARLARRDVDAWYRSLIGNAADAIVELARSFGLRTVVARIEERDQMAPLLRLGGDLAQGFLFARPAGPPEVVRLAAADLAARAPRA